MNMSDDVTNGTVLIADDDPVFRSLVARRIEMLGARPIEASNGSEAWQVLSSQPVDLALIDIDMPGMTGVELIQCIRGYPKTKHLPAVVITSISRSEIVRQALGAGCTAYLTKPLQWAMFGGYIGHLLEMSRKSRNAEAELALYKQVSSKLVTECREGVVAAVLRSGSLDPKLACAEIAKAFEELAGSMVALDPAHRDKNVHAA